MAIYSGPQIVDNGLVLHLDASNLRSYPGSGTAWNDLSTNNNTGTLVNGAAFSTNNNGIITFDGVNDRYSVSTQINLSSTDKISIDFFCKILTYPQIGGGGGILFEASANFNSSTTGLYVGIGEDSSSSFRTNGVQYPISLNIRGNAGYNLYGYDKTLVNDLNWHHWCCIFDKSVSGTNPVESRLFIDGVERSVSVTTTLRNNNTNNFGNDFWYMGSRSNGVAPSNFSIGNFKIYNRVLSSTEIKQNFEATRGRYGI